MARGELRAPNAVRAPDTFDCCRSALDELFGQHARLAHTIGPAKTWVAVDGQRLGFVASPARWSRHAGAMTAMGRKCGTTLHASEIRMLAKNLKHR